MSRHLSPTWLTALSIVLAVLVLVPTVVLAPADASTEYFTKTGEKTRVGRADIAYQVLDRTKPANPSTTSAPRRSPSPKPSPSPTPRPSPSPTPRSTSGTVPGPTPRPEPVSPSFTPDVVLHVAGSDPSASDGASGTASSPLKTIAEALRRAHAENRAGRSVHVRVAAGTYREQLYIGGDDLSTKAPLLVEGERGAVVSASSRYTSWSPVSDRVSAHPWTRDWGLASVPDQWLKEYGADQLQAEPVIRRREIVAVDDRLLKPHTSRAAMEAEAGSFYVDEAADRLYVHWPSGVDPSSAKVEVGEREWVLKINGRQNVTLRGLTFQHATSKPQAHAVSVANTRHVTIEDSRFVRNSWIGLGIYKAHNVTLRRVEADHNGVSGMVASHSDDLWVVDSRTNYNNWRGVRGVENFSQNGAFDPTFVDYATGQKFLYLQRATFRRHTAIGNESSGLWFDFDNRDIVVEDSTIMNNRTWGVFLEASGGPLVVRTSRICGNETGVTLANSEQGLIAANTIGRNSHSEIHVAGVAERWVSFREGGGTLLRPVNWTIEQNRIGSTGPEGRVFGSFIEAAGWDLFKRSLTARGNTYSYGENAKAWHLPDWSRLDLSGWRARAGVDGDSRVTRASAPC